MDKLNKKQRAMEHQMIGITLRENRKFNNQTNVIDRTEAKLKWKFAGHNVW